MQPLRGREIRDYFLENVPDPFLEAVMSRVIEAYYMAADYSRANLSDRAGQSVVGHLKRALIHDMVALVAPQFGVDPTWRANETLSDWHIELPVGRVVMTFATVETRTSLPRQADYRQTLAESAQMELFTTNRRQITDDDTLYALIIHGRTDRLYSPPAFVDVVFPNSECTTYLDRVPLFARFPENPAVLRVAESIAEVNRRAGGRNQQAEGQ